MTFVACRVCRSIDCGDFCRHDGHEADVAGHDDDGN